MLYEIAHIIKDKCHFLWDAIEWANAEVFACMHHKKLGLVDGILKGCSENYILRSATLNDIPEMVAFFAAQPEEAFTFFQPHDFDEKGLKKVVSNKSFLTYLVLEDSAIVGYFFMRSFINNKTFKGYMVDYRQRGKGIAKLMGIAMNKIAIALGLRMYKSISPGNPASMAVTKKVNDIKIIKTLNNGDMLIECTIKTDIQQITGGGGEAAAPPR